MDLELRAGIGKWTSNSIMLRVSSVQIQLDHFRVAEAHIHPVNMHLNIRKKVTLKLELQRFSQLTD